MKFLGAFLAAVTLLSACGGTSFPDTPAGHVQEAGFYLDLDESEINIWGNEVCDHLGYGWTMDEIVSNLPFPNVKPEQSGNWLGLVATFKTYYCP